MGIGESQSFARKLVEVRRLHLPRAVAADIPIAEVVREDEDDVGIVDRRLGGMRRCQRSQQQDGENRQRVSHGFGFLGGFVAQANRVGEWRMLEWHGIGNDARVFGVGQDLQQARGQLALLSRHKPDRRRS